VLGSVQNAIVCFQYIGGFGPQEIIAWGYALSTRIACLFPSPLQASHVTARYSSKAPFLLSPSFQEIGFGPGRLSLFSIHWWLRSRKNKGCQVGRKLDNPVHRATLQHVTASGLSLSDLCRLSFPRNWVRIGFGPGTRPLFSISQWLRSSQNSPASPPSTPFKPDCQRPVFTASRRIDRL